MDPADRFFAGLDSPRVFERLRDLVRARPAWRLPLVFAGILRDGLERVFEAIFRARGSALVVQYLCLLLGKGGAQSAQSIPLDC